MKFLEFIKRMRREWRRANYYLKEDAKRRLIVCACGRVWPWERFGKDNLEDCPKCNPSVFILCWDAEPVGWMKK